MNTRTTLWSLLGAALLALGCDSGGDAGIATDGNSYEPYTDENGVEWRYANLTNYESYPDPGSPECIEYNGCTWAGYFAGIEGQQTLEWVQETNIAAVHSRDRDAYLLKNLRIRLGEREIVATVYDVCSDNDCDGCCTQNAGRTGFLIDLEVHTAARFGVYNGVVEWTCVDC